MNKAERNQVQVEGRPLRGSALVARSNQNLRIAANVQNWGFGAQNEVSGTPKMAVKKVIFRGQLVFFSTVPKTGYMDRAKLNLPEVGGFPVGKLAGLALFRAGLVVLITIVIQFGVQSLVAGEESSFSPSSEGEISRANPDGPKAGYRGEVRVSTGKVPRDTRFCHFCITLCGKALSNISSRGALPSSLSGKG
jgi:hypothetical protein